MTADGDPHPDNVAFEDSDGEEQEADPYLFTMGNRNIQALAIHPTTNELWGADHGPLGGDEIQLLMAGNNYGWPYITGGRDYSGSQFNRAVVARRQPGSAFKPFVYLAAIENGLRPDTIREDRPVQFGNWRPENFSRDFRGPVTLSTALSLSLNTVAATLAVEVGPREVTRVAQRLGIASPLQPNPSIALGTSEVTPLELTAAYVPFANGGFRPEIHFVKRIRSAKGEVLYEHRGASGPRVVRSDVIGMMNAMMAETISEGTARRAAFGWPAAGKTGTSQNARDAWFVGYTANLTTGVWFGNDDGAPTKNITGGSLPAQAWNEFMAAAHEGVPVARLPGGWSNGGGGRLLGRVEDILRGEAASAAPAPQAPVTQAPASQVPAPRAAVPQAPVPQAAGDPHTASIPRPRADVGGEPQRRVGSIMDIILGN